MWAPSVGQMGVAKLKCSCISIIIGSTLFGCQANLSDTKDLVAFDVIKFDRRPFVQGHTIRFELGIFWCGQTQACEYHSRKWGMCWFVM